MKKIIFFLLLAIFFEQSLTAQDTISFKQKIFSATIKDKSHKKTKGYLYAISDSSVFISQTPDVLRFSDIDSTNKQIFNYSRIEYIALVKQGKAGKGVLFGMLIGGLTLAVVGAISSSSQGQDSFEAGSSGGIIAGAALVGVLGGAIVGGIVGGVTNPRFFIHGSKEKFDKMRNKMIANLTISNQ